MGSDRLSISDATGGAPLAFTHEHCLVYSFITVLMQTYSLHTSRLACFLTGKTFKVESLKLTLQLVQDKQELMS